jgi:hypothetical protein
MNFENVVKHIKEAELSEVVNIFAACVERFAIEKKTHKVGQDLHEYVNALWERIE